jgi:hypothetical protein
VVGPDDQLHGDEYRELVACDVQIKLQVAVDDMVNVDGDRMAGKQGAVPRAPARAERPREQLTT